MTQNKVIVVKLFNIVQTCISAKNPASPPPAHVVYAGLEPLEFTNLFPYWEHDFDAEESNMGVCNENILIEANACTYSLLPGNLLS